MPPGTFSPIHFLAELGVVEDGLGGHDTRFEDFLAVIDVVQETVQGGHTLTQALFHVLPFLAGNDARDQVKGDQALGARAGLRPCRHTPQR
jgi:hypothetical protein